MKLSQEGKVKIIWKSEIFELLNFTKMFAKLSKLILDCRIIADDAGFTHTRGSLENTFSFLFFLTETFLVFFARCRCTLPNSEY
jgi:hypothetical protein